MKIRWKELALAFVMAVVLWFGVSGSEKVESIFEVRMDYRGLPEGYVVRSGLVNKVDVRVRAPVGMVRALTARNSIFYMDLSSVKKGENLLLIDSSQLPFGNNVDVIDVTPSRINLNVDVVEKKQVPLVAEVSGSAQPDYVVQVKFSPPEVVLSGPSVLLELVDQLTVQVILDGSVRPGISESPKRLVVPDGLEATPHEIRQSVHIGIKRKLMSVTRQVEVEAPEEFGTFVRPDKVTIELAVPESMAPKAASNGNIKAFVNLEHYQLGTYSLPVLVSLPEGVELVKVEPEQVAVTLEQRKPQQAKPKPAARQNRR